MGPSRVVRHLGGTKTGELRVSDPIFAIIKRARITEREGVGYRCTKLRSN